jgi:hypothetical protein
MTMADLKLIATWKHADRTYRLIADGNEYRLERQVRGGPLEMWEHAASTLGLRDGGLTAVLCAGIERLAEKTRG